MTKSRFYALLQGVLVILFVALIVPSFQAPKRTDKSLGTLMSQALQGVDQGKYPVQDALALRRYVDLNPSEFSETLFYRTDDAMDAEEIIAARFDTKEARKAFEQAVNTRQKSQIDTFEGYAPEQLATVEKARLVLGGNVGLYVAGPQADQIASQFEAAL